MAKIAISLILVIIACTDASQLIRLRSGRECPMPGYFRDQLNCKKFYYCPGGSRAEIALSADDMEILNEISHNGLLCPDDTIFDEELKQCQHLKLIKTIPPECLAEFKHLDSQHDLKTGAVPEIDSNHY